MYVSHLHKDFTLLKGNLSSKALNCWRVGPLLRATIAPGDSFFNSSTVEPPVNSTGLHHTVSELASGLHFSFGKQHCRFKNADLKKERRKKRGKKGRKSNELLYSYSSGPKTMRLVLINVPYQLKLMIREHMAFSFVSCTLKKVIIRMH